MTAVLTVSVVQLVILVEPSLADSISATLTHRGHQLIVSALESLGPSRLVIDIFISVEGSTKHRHVALGGCQLVVHVVRRGVTCRSEGHVHEGSACFLLFLICLGCVERDSTEGPSVIAGSHLRCFLHFFL